MTIDPVTFDFETNVTLYPSAPSQMKDGHMLTMTPNLDPSLGYASVDTTGPSVVSVSMPEDGTYALGEELVFTVNFDEAVTVATAGSTPRLGIVIGSQTVYADYVSGTGTTALSFRYTVQAGQLDANGITVLSLEAHGGVLNDSAGNDAALALQNIGSTAGVQVDGIAPALTITSSNSSLKIDESATITFTFSEDPGMSFDASSVVVSGGTLGPITGSGLTRIATFTPMPNSDNGSASITVAAGRYTDAAGNAGGAGSTPSIIFDTKAPTATGASVVFSNDTGVSSTDLITRAAAQTISGTLTADLAAGDTVYVSLNNGVSWTAATIGGPRTWSLSGQTLTGSDTLIVKVVDAAGNAGTAASRPYTLDTIAPTVSITSNVDRLKIGETATITFTFSEDPGATFTWDGHVGDVVVTGGTLGAISGTGTTRTATFTPAPGVNGGMASITVRANSYADAAGNVAGGEASLSIVINHDHPATFGGTNTGHVTEDGILTTGGQLTVFDPDVDEVGFQAQADIHGTYGTFSFDHLTGGWTYTLDNGRPIVQGLMGGETKQDTFKVKSADGTEHTVTVHVGGADDGETIDGVIVKRDTRDNGDGTTSQVVTIPVVTSGRTEEVGDGRYADIPLVTSGGRTLLSVQVATGIGLTATGSSSPKAAGNSLADLIREIKAHTDAGSFDQASLTGSGSGFLQSLPTDRPLLIQTIVPTGASPGTSLVVNGSSNPNDPQTALVLDARNVPAGTKIDIENVGFIAVIGNVQLGGGSGPQIVYGDSANQHMVLGADDDELHGGGGDDYVGSLGGNDRLYGDDGNDTVSGGIGDDHLFGGAGNDQLLGGAGHDRLYGDAGNDSLKGEAGKDWIIGGLGRDKMWGGAGRDVFDFNSVKESKVGSQRDVIYDFKSGQDRIDLRDIDANELRKGNQKFSWTGSDGPFLYPKESAAFLKAGFTGEAGQLRYANGILMGDTDGDRKADFQIKILGRLSAGDVIL